MPEIETPYPDPDLRSVRMPKISSSQARFARPIRYTETAILI